MLSPNERSGAVRPSGIRAVIDALALRSERERADIVPLHAGEPDFNAPEHVWRAGYEAAARGARYEPSPGIPALREAIAGKLARVNGVDVPPDRVVVSQGSVQACRLVLSAVLDAGDDVLISDPAWPNYDMITRHEGARPVRYRLRPDDGFVPDVAELRRLMGPRTRVLVLNSPGNPTGMVVPAGLLEEIAALCRERDVLLLSDEAYDQLAFDGTPASPASLAPDHAAALFSFSKTYAMTGWRVGYAVAPAWLAPTLATLQQTVVGCVSAVSQAGALAALEGPQEVVDHMRRVYQERAAAATEALLAGGVAVAPPRATFFMLVPLADGADAEACSIDLLDSGVAVVPGSAFGEVTASHVRIALARGEDELRLGIERLLAWYERTDGGLAVAAGPGGAAARAEA